MRLVCIQLGEESDQSSLQILKPAEKKQRFVYVGSIPKDSKKGTMK